MSSTSKNKPECLPLEIGFSLVQYFKKIMGLLKWEKAYLGIQENTFKILG
jgi:hypothetical protein